MADGFLFELYHENSKLSLWDWEQFAQIEYVNTATAAARLADAPAVDIGCLEQIWLPRPSLPTMTLERALGRRRSAQRLGGGAVDLDQLGTVLHFSMGLNGALAGQDGVPAKALRFSPSPGGLYPLTALVEARRVTGLAAGVYAYDPGPHALGRLDADLDALARATTQGPSAIDPAMNLWLFCRFDRLSFKYGERSYRFALLEAGHVAQNALLVCATLELPARPFAGFLDDLATRAIDLSGLELVPLYFVGIAGAGA